MLCVGTHLGDSMTDDIEQRLRDMDSARTNMQARLDETSAALDAISEKIDTLNARQETRMRSDERISNKVVNSVVQGGQSTKEKAAKKLSEQEQNPKPKEQLTLLREELTEEDVTVQPGEKYTR
jgi:hypothetical protein